jgi:hypothetical protein
LQTTTLLPCSRQPTPTPNHRDAQLNLTPAAAEVDTQTSSIVDLPHTITQLPNTSDAQPPSTPDLPYTTVLLPAETDAHP